MLRKIIKNRASVYLVVSCIAIFGISTYAELPRESFPDIDIPTVMVSTPYIGVAPEDIENLVTIPLENELAGLQDLKKMTSTSAEGVSLVMLEFEPDVVIEDKLQRVRDRVSKARPKIPEDTEETDVQEISFDQFPIMIITISGQADEETLKAIGERVEDEVGRIDGVLEANLSGGLEREIRIEVDPIRLQYYKLSLNDVIGAIAQENVNIPGGDVTAGDANFLVRVPGDFKEAKEIERVAIKRVGDVPVFVSDVAQVVDGYEDRATFARVSGEPAVTVAVTKRAGANILEVADTAKAVVAEQAKGWPKGIQWRVIGDQSRDTRMMVSELENNVLTALILVVAVILLFMGVRNSLFIAFAIPLSLMLSMIVIAAFGLTLNMMVLFSLILGLGMLVDNSIVIVENIYRHVEEGKSLLEASITGTKEVAIAVTASTATTVAAFLPLVFWTGIMGEFMGYLPKTVIIVLISSLLVAIIVLPVFTARFMKRGTGSVDGESAFMQTPLMRRYQTVLNWSIDHRYLSAFLGFATLVVTFIAYGFLNHGTEFFPDMEPDRAIVTIRAPDGTDVEATDRITQQVEEILLQEDNINFFVSETGVSGGDPLQGSQAVSNQARITIDFPPHETRLEEGQIPRHEDTRLTVDRIRKQLPQITGAEIEINKEENGPPVGSPISVEVSGEDFHEVGEMASRLRRQIADAVPGAANLSDDYRVGRPEMRLRIDRGAAKRVGASTESVAGALRAAIHGTKASTFRDGKDEYDITVRLAREHRMDLQSILALRIPGREDTSPDTFAVPLSSVARYELAGGNGSVRHIDQDLVVTISGDIQEGQNQNAVQAQVVDLIEKAELPEGFHVRLGGSNDEQKSSEEFLGKAFLIAVFLISIVLVTQFGRFDLPMIILASVILSLIGVLWGLIITGTSFGVIMTGIGVISLAGVVVNNAIVLLDYVEQLREQGLPMREALVKAGMTRFRPVILTALTTLLGLVPMAIGLSVDFVNLKIMVGSQSAQWWGPMAVAVIFGLAFATVLTLVLVPTMYSIMEDLQVKRAKAVTALRRLLGRDTTPAE